MFISRIVLAAVLSLAASSAIACEGQTGKVIYEDKFIDDAGGWSFSAEGLRLKTPGAVLRVQPSETADQRLAQNHTFNAAEGDFCTEMSYPPNAIEAGATFGLIFWGIDYDNFWQMNVYADGGVIALFKFANGKWNKIWQETDAAAVKTGSSDVNSIRAIVKGGTITVIVNGKTIKGVRAMVPAGDLKFGFRSGRAKPTAAPLEFTIHSFKVTEVK